MYYIAIKEGLELRRVLKILFVSVVTMPSIYYNIL